MKTISAEQFKKLYGTVGVAQVEATKPSAGQRISSAFKAGVNQVKEGFAEAGQLGDTTKKQNPLTAPLKGFEAVGKIGAGIANAAFSPLAPAIEPTVGAAINYAGDKISNSPTVQKFANSKAGEITSRAAENVGNFNTIAGAVAGSKTAMGIPKTVGPAIESGLTGVREGAGAIAERFNPNKALTGAELESQLIKDATPSYSKKLVGQSPVKDSSGVSTPRISEGGLIKGRTVNPSQLEVQAGQALKNIKDYPVNGTNLEKYQSVQPEISRQSTMLAESLKSEGVLRPPQQIASVVKKAIRQTAEDSLLLQKTDPIIKNYVRVLKNAIDANDGTLAGELNVRQSMDAAYKNARGKAAFGSDTISALDEIHSAARDALNQDIIDHARSTDVKASLKAQWDLLRAADVLRDKAEAEAQTSIGRFQQKNPITSKVIRGAGRAAGVGIGVDVLR